MVNTTELINKIIEALASNTELADLFPNLAYYKSIDMNAPPDTEDVPICIVQDIDDSVDYVGSASNLMRNIAVTIHWQNPKSYVTQIVNGVQVKSLVDFAKVEKVSTLVATIVAPVIDSESYAIDALSILTPSASIPPVYAGGIIAQLSQLNTLADFLA